MKKPQRNPKQTVYTNPKETLNPNLNPMKVIYIYTYTWTSKSCVFLSGLKSSERPRIEQLLILPSVSHIWKDQKYDAK